MLTWSHVRNITIVKGRVSIDMRNMFFSALDELIENKNEHCFNKFT